MENDQRELLTITPDALGPVHLVLDVDASLEALLRVHLHHDAVLATCHVRIADHAIVDRYSVCLKANVHSLSFTVQNPLPKRREATLARGRSSLRLCLTTVIVVHYLKCKCLARLFIGLLQIPSLDSGLRLALST